MFSPEVLQMMNERSREQCIIQHTGCPKRIAFESWSIQWNMGDAYIQMNRVALSIVNGIG